MSERLLQRRRRLLAQLPALDEILRGSVVERSIRCGRSSCHCAAGDGHPSVYLSVTHPGGRTEQISVPAALQADVRRGVRAYQRWWEILEQVSAVNRMLLRERRLNMRETTRQRQRRGG